MLNLPKPRANKENAKLSYYPIASGIEMHPKWYARFLWQGLTPEAKNQRISEEMVEKSDIDLQSSAGNPLNLEVEHLSNVPGKYFKRKR